MTRAWLFIAALACTAPAAQHLRFMKAKPWVRHDEHYHVDFAVRCKPMS